MFKRPVNLEFPHVYCTFTGKDKGGEGTVEYRIQDIPEDRYEEALNMMLTVFLPDEPISYSVLNNPDSFQVLRNAWMKTLQSRLSIGCFRNDGSDELVGMNVLTVVGKNDPEDDPLGDENAQCIWDLMEYAGKQADVFNRYNVDYYLSAIGLTVSRDYRGCGLATELLKARVPLMKYVGLKVTSTSFTGVGSQTAAKRAGFEELYVKTYDELKEISPRFDFKNNRSKIFKIMALKI